MIYATPMLSHTQRYADGFCRLPCQATPLRRHYASLAFDVCMKRGLQQSALRLQCMTTSIATRCFAAFAMVVAMAPCFRRHALSVTIVRCCFHAIMLLLLLFRYFHYLLFYA